MQNTTAAVSLAVIGNPITHSRSPDIHHAFARQLGLAVQYEKRLAPLDDFAGSVAAFFSSGGKGANVTLPFKQQAYALCQQVTPRARVAGAVNTLWYENNHLHGDNTDGLGLVTDMEANLGWSLAGKKLLILGAGGAVRGILQPLSQAGIKDITVANRTWETVAKLAHDMQHHDIHVTPLALANLAETLESRSYDLIINAISAGLSGQMPNLPTKLSTGNPWCYDLVYAAGLTPFLTWAQAHGCRQFADGFGMLVEQAAASFERWLGCRPNTSQLITELR